MHFHNKILIALINFISDRGIQVNILIGAISFTGISDVVKLLAILIGAIYTSFKFHKEFIKDAKWWRPFCYTFRFNKKNDDTENI